jgi:MFS family permease
MNRATTLRGFAVTIYASGFVQGIVMVAFAASSTVLREGHGFSDTQYGSIFVPQVAGAALGAVGGGMFVRALGLRRLLAASFLAMALSQAALATSHFFEPAAAFAAVVAGTSLMGLGAGLGAGPLNTHPQTLFPARRYSAVIAMHVAMGLGLALGPLAVGVLAPAGLWLAFPLGLCAACLGLAGAGRRANPPPPKPAAPSATVAGRPWTAPDFWLFVAAAFLYAVTEAGYSNWAVIYLSEEKGLSLTTASLALTTFWLALSSGRVLVAGLVARLPAEPAFLTLPLLMAGASFLLPTADDPARAIAVFAVAGFGCSAFYPLALGLASRRFPGCVAWVNFAMFASLAAGVGAGSYLLGALRATIGLDGAYRLSALWALLVFALAALAVARPAVRQPGPLGP